MSGSNGEVLTREECCVLVKRSRFGRLALSIDALPVISPINYVVNGESILFCTSGASDLYAATVGSVVAFEVDAYDSVGYLEWNVLVRGIGLDVTMDAEFGLSHPLSFSCWPTGEQLDRFVTIPMTLVTGRRFV